MRGTNKVFRRVLEGLILVLVLPPAVAAQTWIELAPSGSPPDPIYGPKPVQYDTANNRLIMFVPGNPAYGGFGNQVWVLMNANGLGGLPAWSKLEPMGMPPDSNSLESVVYDELANRLIVYGGCLVNCSPARHRVFVLTNANGLGGTPVWSESTVTNPQPRVDHSAVYDAASNSMITFGGHFAFYGTDQNDTRVLSNANGLASPSAWTTLATLGGPPGIRGRHSAIYDPATNRMTIFAGQHLISCCSPYVQSDYNDVWVLANANGQAGAPTWIQLAPVGVQPDVRSGHSAVYDSANNRMLVFGGWTWNQAKQTGDPLGDLWELSHANGLGGASAWTQIAASGTPPGPRAYHWAAFDASNQRMILVGGRNDNEAPPTSNRVWVLVLVQAVTIDVKPGSFPNSINPKSKGVIPVAVLTTETFDVSTLDPATVFFGPTGAEAAPEHFALEDIDGDGDTDMVLHFRTQSTGIRCGDVSAALKGETFGGQRIEGSDSIRTAGCE